MTATPAAKTPAKRPAAAKKPQDRKPKANAVTAETEATGTAVTVNLHGVDWELDPASMDDFEVVGWIADIDAGGPDAAFAAPALMKRLLGDEQFHQAMNVLRDPKTGRVSVQAGSEFCVELLQASAPNS